MPSNPRRLSTLGKSNYSIKQAQLANLQFRRSVYLVEDIKQGERLTVHNIRRIRPGFGLPPKHYPQLLGNTASMDVSRGEALNWSMIET